MRKDGVFTDADTCREFVTPRLVEAGWGAAPHAIDVPAPSLAAQQTFNHLQAKVGALKAKHLGIRQANASLQPATLERVFAENP